MNCHFTDQLLEIEHVYSFVLGHGIALALLTPDVAEGDAVGIDVRGKELPGRVVALPFLPR